VLQKLAVWVVLLLTVPERDIELHTVEDTLGEAELLNELVTQEVEVRESVTDKVEVPETVEVVEVVPVGETNDEEL